jgi:hypothetical protein
MFKTAALSVAAGLAAPRLAPPPVALTLPTAPVLAAPRLAAPTLTAPLLPAAPLPALRSPAAPVNAAKATAPSDDARRLMDRAPRMMELQAALLDAAAARTGKDRLTLSVGMSLAGNGLSLADFDAMLTELDALEADLPEAAAALDAEFDSGNLRAAFQEGADPREGLSLMAAVMRDVATAVEIRRNGRFMSWFWDYEAGRADAAVSFSGSGVAALSEGRFMVTFGSLDGVPLRVTLHTLGGKVPSARRWLEGAERSPFATPERAAGLTRLRAQLAAFGLLGD